jgi:Glycosyl hydrolases family 39
MSTHMLRRFRSLIALAAAGVSLVAATACEPDPIAGGAPPVGGGGTRQSVPFPDDPGPLTWTSEEFSEPFVPIVSTKPSITGEVAPGWTENSAWADVDVDYSSTEGREGGTAQRMVVGAVRGEGSQAQIFREIPLAVGWRYEATMWVKGTGGIDVAIRQDSEPYAAFGETTKILSGDWEQVRFTGIQTLTGTGFLAISASKPVDLSIDDVTLKAQAKEAAAVTGTEITSDTFGIHEGNVSIMAMLNSGFEQPTRVAGFGKPIAETGAVINGEVASGWGDNSFWADVDVNYALDAEVVHGGETSQRVEVGAIRSGEAQVGQYMEIRTTAQLRVSQWMRGAAGTSGRLDLREDGVPYATLASTEVTFTGDWQQVVVESNLDAANSGVFIHAAFVVPGTYWLDDTEIIDVATGAAPDWMPAPSVGGTMRLWDTQTTWSRLEPAPGVWDFSLLDRYVDLADSRNQQVVLTLGQSPPWASSNTDEVGYNGLGSVYPPASINDWRNMVSVIATRYKGRIDAYEIWNEPHDANFGIMSVDKLVELTNAASEEVRAVDPDALMISASPYLSGYLDAYLAAGGGDAVDIIGYHHYNTSIEAMYGELSNVRYILEDYGIDKPLWLTEGGTGDPSQDENVVADALLRWNLTAIASGMQRAFWYTWGQGIDLSGATATAGTWEPNAAFRALADMQQRLAGRTLTSVAADTTTGAFVLEFTDATGNVLTASWTRGGTAPEQPVTWS